tara:strand:+ start:327 stop:485 length:159 start_codon:yes stop_codon:yes gene_type:complete
MGTSKIAKVDAEFELILRRNNPNKPFTQITRDIGNKLKKNRLDEVLDEMLGR